MPPSADIQYIYYTKYHQKKQNMQLKNGRLIQSDNEYLYSTDIILNRISMSEERGQDTNGVLIRTRLDSDDTINRVKPESKGKANIHNSSQSSNQQDSKVNLEQSLKSSRTRRKIEPVRILDNKEGTNKQDRSKIQSVKLTCTNPQNTTMNSIQKSNVGLAKQQKTNSSKRFCLYPILRCGGFLKHILMEQDNNRLYQCQRTSSFPCSRFRFTQINQSKRTFELVSSFTGSQYHLYEQQLLILSIYFETGCGSLSNRGRNVDLYGLKNRKSTVKNDNLKQSYQACLSQNIVQLSSLPAIFDNRQQSLYLQFTNKVSASTQNTILCNIQGERVLQFYKIHSNEFECLSNDSVPKQWTYAFSLACLDFKLAVQ